MPHANAAPDFIMPETSNVGRSFAGHMPPNRPTDFMLAYPQLIAFYVDKPFTALGMGGFGSGGTRSWRRFFKVGIAMSPRSFRDRGRFRARKSRSNRLRRLEAGRRRDVRVEGNAVSLHEHARGVIDRLAGENPLR